MSGYTFEEIPKLKKALTNGEIEAALSFVPTIDIEAEEYRYLALLGEIQSIFLSYHKENNQQALLTTIQLISSSKNLSFTEDWPQFTDLISNIVGVIAQLEKGKERENLLTAILEKLSLRDGYVINHSGLNYNLACFYASNDEAKIMMEYIRRSMFSFGPEKFLTDKSFEKYMKESFFLDPLENDGFTMFTWWSCLWPIQEWYEDVVD